MEASALCYRVVYIINRVLHLNSHTKVCPHIPSTFSHRYFKFYFIFYV